MYGKDAKSPDILAELLSRCHTCKSNVTLISTFLCQRQKLLVQIAKNIDSIFMNTMTLMKSIWQHDQYYYCVKYEISLDKNQAYSIFLNTNSFSQT